MVGLSVVSFLYIGDLGSYAHMSFLITCIRALEAGGGRA